MSKHLQFERNKVKLAVFLYFEYLKNIIIQSENTDDLNANLDLERNSRYSQTLLEIFKCISKATIKTKRDVYYGATELFKTQGVLDTIVSDLCQCVKVPRDALNLVATSKGLVFGAITINNTMAKSALLIPSGEEIESIHCDGKFVLVVEKDAAMVTIIQHYAQMSLDLGAFVIVTGKGYPCLKTTQFLNLIENKFPTLPIFCLTDHDPFGIHISLFYASKSAFENDCCKSSVYLGVTRNDIDLYADKSQCSVLQEADVKKIYNLRKLANELGRTDELNELILMQNSREKAEIESILSGDGKLFCLKYLVPKLKAALQQ